jgi:hypothetical protein
MTESTSSASLATEAAPAGPSSAAAAEHDADVDAEIVIEDDGFMFTRTPGRKKRRANSAKAVPLHTSANSNTANGSSPAPVAGGANGEKVGKAAQPAVGATPDKAGQPPAVASGIENEAAPLKPKSAAKKPKASALGGSRMQGPTKLKSTRMAVAAAR